MECSASNGDEDKYLKLRILSVFIVMIGSGIGAYFPVISSTYSAVRFPDWVFFGVKFFGSGVIIATAFVHLLHGAQVRLGNECLGGTFVQYPWAFGICLMALFAVFLLELITEHFAKKANTVIDQTQESIPVSMDETRVEYASSDSETISTIGKKDTTGVGQNEYNNVELEKECIKNMDETNDSITEAANNDLEKLEVEEKEKYSAQLFAVSIFEFGIIFHSIFVGLALAVAGKDFRTLFVVITFHQFFEGLGLGARIADIKWPENRRYTPWLLALGFTITTPIGIAIGIGLNQKFVPGSRNALIIIGVFNSISAGILIYTGLVELIAHEFFFTDQFDGKDGSKKKAYAYIMTTLGCGLMALIGKWG